MTEEENPEKKGEESKQDRHDDDVAMEYELDEDQAEQIQGMLATDKVQEQKLEVPDEGNDQDKQ